MLLIRKAVREARDVELAKLHCAAQRAQAISEKEFLEMMMMNRTLIRLARETVEREKL